ncbi:type II toxin-antitoxin system PemK/MazF family toxin [Rhodoblastus acidophilus]|uniref:Type II toxin-antitoxin system PemK/MazF family toxin n=1 Tax=Rhodoblastus acidophilus TaxID=1074 RepID=A0A6N8DIL0_RHOAC|nr:type II toxin-antitoxin system PemK/MazF family toxin [Rhodoblastus acidophilus]MCW2273202.1 mRNA interferase MazF [Rhodoblastus acidophilus]MTV30098.1 type II toxin-antitoxin system PemK/MazF family toxin [Rhodoblastus acidophilus]
MPSFEQGDVVRVPFPYTDRATRQFRPALVVSDGAIGEGGALLWVAMITSAENRRWAGDIAFGETFASSGLPAPSVVRPCKIATIDSRHAERLGKAPPAVAEAVMAALRRLIGDAKPEPLT